MKLKDRVYLWPHKQIRGTVTKVVVKSGMLTTVKVKWDDGDVSMNYPTQLRKVNP